MLLDIGAGILLALLVGKLWALPVSFGLIAAGIGFSLLMDLDAAIDLVKHRGAGKSYRHRDLFHYPLVYMPLGVAVTYLIGIYSLGGAYGPALAALFALCSLSHFIHDSVGLGWGIAWLWPFSTDRYSFLYQCDVWPSGLRPRRGIYVWKDEEIDALELEYGDKDWFRHLYLSLHPYGLAELAVFLAGLAALWLTIR